MNRQTNAAFPIVLPTPSQPWQTHPTKPETPAVKKYPGRYVFVGDPSVKNSGEETP